MIWIGLALSFLVAFSCFAIARFLAFGVGTRVVVVACAALRAKWSVVLLFE